MKTIGQQALEYMQKEGLNSQEMSDRIKAVTNRKVWRQSIEALIGASGPPVERPAYILELARTMRTSAETLRAGSYVWTDRSEPLPESALMARVSQLPLPVRSIWLRMAERHLEELEALPPAAAIQQSRHETNPAPQPGAALPADVEQLAAELARIEDPRVRKKVFDKVLAPLQSLVAQALAAKPRTPELERQPTCAPSRGPKKPRARRPAQS